MRLLIDTQTLVWSATEPRRLSERAVELVGDVSHERLLSAVTAWELATKSRLGKFPIPPELLAPFIADQVAALRLEELAIDRRHGLATASLPLHHRDPFDRLLVAQAQVEGLASVTNDPAIARYGVETIW
jgi:PIN domain nuclease of toxin-antitoxin system